jgi:hypothetical protein
MAGSVLGAMRVHEETHTSAPSPSPPRYFPHARLAIAAQNNGTHVTRPHAVVAHGIEQGLHQLVAGKRHVDAIDLGRIEQPLNVLLGAEDGPAAGQRVAAYALKHRRAIVHHVRHHMNGRVIPVNQLAVVPDLVGLLDGHADSFENIIAEPSQQRPDTKVTWRGMWGRAM